MPPQPKHIQQLQKAILAAHGCKTRHFTTVPVRAVVRGEVAFDGEVEVFDVRGHPTAGTCYAWSYDENGTTQTAVILGIAPVVSAEAAVEAVMAEEPRRAKE